MGYYLSGFQPFEISVQPPCSRPSRQAGFIRDQNIFVRIRPPPRSGSVNQPITTWLPETETSASEASASTTRRTQPVRAFCGRSGGEFAGTVDYDWAVGQFYATLYKFAFGLTGSESDAADLTQDTYHVLLAKGDAIRDTRKVKSWLFTTLYRQFLGRRRHAVRFPETSVDTAEWELRSMAATQIESLDASQVVAALHELEEKYRAPLTLFYLEDLAYKEMAVVLGLPIGTIMSRLSRGKEILRKRLQRPPSVTVHSSNDGGVTGRLEACSTSSYFLHAR